MGDPSVTPSVVRMTYHRLAYDDAATTTEMASDARQAGRTLHLPEQSASVDVLGDPTDPRPAHQAPPPFQVSDELAGMAAGLELHFD